MKSLKKGDKVKVIKRSTICGSSTCCIQYVNKIGTVKTNEYPGHSIEVHEFPDSDQWCSGFSRDCLELIELDWDE